MSTSATDTREGFVTSTPALRERYPSIDIARGFIMVVMAIDHASMYWNAGKPKPCLEGAVGLPPIDYGTLAQQITREITHICAPGFQLLAGMGLAIFVWRRAQAGLAGWRINIDLIVRGLALLFCEFVVLYWVVGQLPFAFLVLACIGCNIMLFAGLRYLPTALIGLLSLIGIAAGPLYLAEGIVPTDASRYLLNALLHVAIGAADGRSFLVIYPILPWIGCFGMGWCLGEMYERGHVPRGKWLCTTGAIMIVAAFFLRWFGGSYAERIAASGGPWTSGFWVVSKYPPSPVFLLATLGFMLVMLGALRRMDGGPVPAAGWRALQVYGRAPLFFYVLHFHVYAFYPYVIAGNAGGGGNNQWELPTTFAVWAAGVLLLYYPCLWYHRLRKRFPAILKYF